jgi:hypothetical protein
VVPSLTLRIHHASFQLKVNLKYSCLPFELSHTLPYTSTPPVIKKAAGWVVIANNRAGMFRPILPQKFTGEVKGLREEQLKVNF